MITLKRMMRIAEPNEPWTMGTENGVGWLFYFDGTELHNGTTIPFEEFLERNCIKCYKRPERKRSNYIKLPANFYNLEAGLAFIVKGDESGDI